MRNDFIITPASPQASIKAHVGGKGANLGLLTAAGFAVPPWFCVSTVAHRQFLRDSGLEQQITEIANRIDFADMEQTERETARIRELIEQTPFPEDTRQEVWAAYQALGDQPFVAVRSSAVAEDLAEASFAGISGIVAETGGLLSHFACLAREYGLPNAQVENALRLIPDGATITLDGDTGQVLVAAAHMAEVAGGSQARV